MSGVRLPDADGPGVSVQAPLRPGDTDPRTTPQTAQPVMMRPAPGDGPDGIEPLVSPVLRPGDDTPGTTVQTMRPVVVRLKPGDCDGPEPEWEARAMPPARPGGSAGSRPTVLVKRKV